MAARRSTGSGPKDGATSPQAQAAAFGDRLSQLENDMAEIRDGTMKDVLVKLRLLSDEIEEINRRSGTVDRTGNTLDDLRVKVNSCENDMADFRRQIERSSTPLPSQNQQAATFPIFMYSGERSSLSRFLKQFHCIPPLIGQPSLRFYAVGSSLFLLSVCFCLCSLFYRDDVLCWLHLVRPFLYAFHAHLRFPV